MERIHTFLVLLLLLDWFPFRTQSTLYHDSIAKDFSGSAMNFIDNSGKQFLTSSSGNFSLCFYSQGTSFYVSIIHMPSQKVVWIANRDKPISQFDNLSFKLNGNLMLTSSADSEVVWSTNTSGYGAVKMQMQDSGNLALLDKDNITIWQSFDHPTDTLLLGQMLKSDARLVSEVSSSSVSSGPYSLSFTAGRDVRLIYTLGSDSSNLSVAYWSMSMDARLVTLLNGTPSYAKIDSTGLTLVSQGGSVISTISFTCTTLCAATLNPDGNLVISVYALNVWTPLFQALNSSCDLPLYCGPLGLCSGGQCSCPNPLQVVDKKSITQGCKAPAVEACSSSSNSSGTVRFEKILDNVDYFANKYVKPIAKAALNECKQMCADNCSCNFFFFDSLSADCYLYGKLGTLKSTSASAGALYARSATLDSSDPSVDAKGGVEGFPQFVLPVIIVGSILIIIAMTSVFLYWYFKMRRIDLTSSTGRGKHDEEEGGEEDQFLDTFPNFPCRYSYKDLQNATNNFSKRLGGGGFGSVYEGVLSDNSKVAVKQLEGIGQGKKEFRAEVAIIGSIHHVHLVHLRGFCVEGLHRLLVYEFMANGSLDKHLFHGAVNPNVLDWNTRVKIALGTARGLAYLHDDCRDKVIHCDIKPENILLDENFNAKLSDFGLAKLMDKEQSQVFTTMRGTRGYLAPEWLMNLAISEKSDVYSFGMVLLELIAGRKNFEPHEVSEKRYFPAYAVHQIERGSPEDLIDKRLGANAASSEELLRLIRIALWCIQVDTTLRPSMNKVVQMLEGSGKIEEPPSSEAIQLHARMMESLTSSQPSCTTTNTSHLSLLSSVELSGPR